MEIALNHGYDFTCLEDRNKLNEYFDNYQPYNFTHGQWSCWIISGPVRNMNGYIEVNEEFIDWLKDCDYFDTLSVHGGITWEGGELTIPEMEGKYVIGFDTAHFMDVILYDIDPEHLKIFEGTRLESRKRDFSILNEKRLWLESDVEEELKRLADQLDGLYKKAYPHGR